MTAFVTKPAKATKFKPLDLGTFDIETVGIGGEYLGGMTNSYQFEHKFHRRAGSLFRELLAYPGKTWFAHNGAAFDFTYFAAFLKDWVTAEGEGRTLETVSQGDKVIGVVLKTEGQKRKDQIVIRDSYALIPSSLDSMTS